MYKQVKAHLNTLFIFLAVIGASAILARSYLHRNQDADRIYVTGSGSQDFKSDLGNWTGSYSVENIDLIAKISREATELINQGIEINSNPPTYYYSNLGALKIEMVAAATEDGRVRAEQIASKANGSLGELKNANLGVFQITSQSGDEEYSWGGTYNTSSIYKTASITVRLEFGVH